MSSGEYGKDLASVESLLKKHNSVEADILAHEVIYDTYNKQHHVLLNVLVHLILGEITRSQQPSKEVCCTRTL